jgi:molecular chaperone DnaJ
MAPRPALPDDDLYRRLGVPTDASVEAIELAWRGLLRRHHPDVAGPDGLELAKRINVAHDWLTDPALRAHYDRERGLRHAVGPRGGTWHARGQAPPAASTRPPPPPRRPPDPAAAADRFIARVAALTPTEIDRLALAEPPPIAFGATIRRFLPPPQLEALVAIEDRIAANLPPGADRPPVRDAIDGYATELVLGPFLDELLSEPFRGRTRERLTRGWEAAVGQPRFGPNGAAVEDMIRRLGGLDPAGVRRLAATAGLVGAETPWPPSVSLEEEDGLRISAQLAARDATAAVPGGVDAATRSQARRAVARPAHLLVLRHAFPLAVYSDLVDPWRPWLIPEDPRGARVRSRSAR